MAGSPRYHKDLFEGAGADTAASAAASVDCCTRRLKARSARMTAAAFFAAVYAVSYGLQAYYTAVKILDPKKPINADTGTDIAISAAVNGGLGFIAGYDAYEVPTFVVAAWQYLVARIARPSAGAVFFVSGMAILGAALPTFEGTWSGAIAVDPGYGQIWGGLVAAMGLVVRALLTIKAIPSADKIVRELLGSIQDAVRGVYGDAVNRLSHLGKLMLGVITLAIGVGLGGIYTATQHVSISKAIGSLLGIYKDFYTWVQALTEIISSMPNLIFNSVWLSRAVGEGVQALLDVFDGTITVGERTQNLIVAIAAGVVAWRSGAPADAAFAAGEKAAGGYHPATAALPWIDDPIDAGTIAKMAMISGDAMNFASLRRNFSDMLDCSRECVSSSSACGRDKLVVTSDSIREISATGATGAAVGGSPVGASVSNNSDDEGSMIQPPTCFSRIASLFVVRSTVPSEGPEEPLLA